MVIIFTVHSTRQLQYGRVPGAFLAFSLLPGIVRVVMLSGVVVDWRFTWTCAYAYSLTINVSIRVLNFCGWSQPRNFLNSEIYVRWW